MHADDRRRRDELAGELAIARLVAQYCQAVDDGRFDAVAQLFATDGTFAVDNARVTGRAALAEYLAVAQAPRLRGRHVCSHPVVEFDGDLASALTDFVFFVGRADRWMPKVIGRYRDELTCATGSWLLTERVVEILEPSSSGGE